MKDQDKFPEPYSTSGLPYEVKQGIADELEAFLQYDENE